MSLSKSAKRERIKHRVRKKITGTSERPRLSVFRSNTRIYAQIIDDSKGTTLAAASTFDLGADKKSTNIETAKQVGAKIAEKALAAGVSTVSFDRGGYLYHGKIKALADGAREGGLKF